MAAARSMLTNKRTDNKYSGRQTLHVYNVITLFLKLLHPYLLDEEDLQAHSRSRSRGLAHERGLEVLADGRGEVQAHLRRTALRAGTQAL